VRLSADWIIDCPHRPAGKAALKRSENHIHQSSHCPDDEQSSEHQRHVEIGSRDQHYMPDAAVAGDDLGYNGTDKGFRDSNALNICAAMASTSPLTRRPSRSAGSMFLQ
jgi:hypothetical protein